MKLAIDDMKIRRDMYRNNAEVASKEAQERVNEANRLRKTAAELDDAIMILEDRDS